MNIFFSKPILMGDNLYIPERLRKKKVTNHKKKGRWISMIYYRDRREVDKKEFHTLPNNIKYIGTSLCEYHEDTYYKLSHISKTDEIFDYYVRTKPYIPKEVYRRNDKFFTHDFRRRYIEGGGEKFRTWKKVDKGDHETDGSGNFIVRFQ